MTSFKYSGLLLAGLMISSGAWGAQKKSCMRQARAEYRMEIKSCKAKPKDSRSACIKEAKEKEKSAKTACKKTT